MFCYTHTHTHTGCQSDQLLMADVLGRYQEMMSTGGEGRAQASAEAVAAEGRLCTRADLEDLERDQVRPRPLAPATLPPVSR